VRLQGVASVADVQAAFVEGNGQISVITADDQSRGNQMRGVSSQKLGNGRPKTSSAESQLLSSNRRFCPARRESLSAAA
jgi:uncharacterized membrane protein YcaP (DUF421 family)